jgi:hypothetical protein
LYLKKLFYHHTPLLWKKGAEDWFEMVCDFFPETFGENFSKPGCMYRGPPPEGKLFHLSDDYQVHFLCNFFAGKYK